MAQLMTNIQWEKTKCHICDSQDISEDMMMNGKQIVDGQFGYSVHPVICKCGMVFLSPRWSKKDYDIFYKDYYDDLYRLEIKPDYGIEGVRNNMAVIWDRIGDQVAKNIKTIVDVGCGSGHGLKYIKNQIPDSEIYGIESSPECCEILCSDEIDATLITKDFDSDWEEEHRGKFDLIILRHVVEHMLSPVETLKKLRVALSKNGFIYLATPDMMSPRTKLRDYDNWWEYWFRAVHPYYYSKDTLFRTLELAGLFPGVYGEENEEVWCLASLEKSIHFELNSVYEKQNKVFNTLLPGYK